MLRAVTLVTTVTRDTVTWMEIRSECSIKVDSHAQTQGVHNSTIQGVWGRWWCCAHARAQVVVSRAGAATSWDENSGRAGTVITAPVHHYREKIW